MKSVHALLPLLTLSACQGGGTDTSSETGDSSADTGADSEVDATVTGCDDATTQVALAVCAADAFLAGLDSSQTGSAVYDFDDSTARTQWSNLPGVTRAGVAFGDLSDDSREAAMNLARALLSDEGYADLLGILAADDYLGTQGGGGGGPGASAYTSDNAHIAIFGTPSATSSWSVLIGNHHMAFMVTWVAGVGYPTPLHQGVEPKGSFTVNGESYAPLDDDGARFFALFDGLDSSQLSSAYLSGQVFGDVVLGPDEFDSGDLSRVVYPTSEGLLVSELDATQQALVTTALEAWVRTFDAGISDALVDAYTSETAYAQTRIAWAGSSSGPDVDTNGTYLRIDGPRVWIEVAMQSGVMLSGTHYHTMYRDKQLDYGGTL